MSDRKIKITRLLRPYWHQLAVAFVAILAESATDLLEPWPLKIVFDYVFGSKQMPGWMAAVLSRTTGLDRVAVLNFAAAAVLLIAAVSAVSTYAEKYLTTSVGQRVMHDLRLTLYNHIQRLSLSFFAEQKTGDLIVRMTSDIDAVQDFVSMALLARSVKAKLAPFVELIVAAGTCLVLWYGARLVLSGQISPGALIVFILYLGKMYKPMRDLSKMTDTVSKAQVGFERIREVLRTESQVRDLPGARRAPAFRGRVEFERVSFSYDSEHPVLRDVNLSVEPGQFIALVGPTGGGKTTLMSLIPRFYDPTSGRVKIDGMDIRSFTLKSLRDQISYVLQETYLFRAAVWENIAYGKPSASRAEIVRAARLANAHEFITHLPEGYDTVIGERGETLSGGQRQRITIARAIIRDTPLLLLDEPSSGLDAESEEVGFQALARLIEGKTSVVIAHRLATVMRAERILLIEDGSIVENGTHDELLARGGLYSHLYEIQFKGQEASDLKAVGD